MHLSRNWQPTYKAHYRLERDLAYRATALPTSSYSRSYAYIHSPEGRSRSSRPQNVLVKQQRMLFFAKVLEQEVPLLAQPTVLFLQPLQLGGGEA